MPPATTARSTNNYTTLASQVPPTAALRADHAPPRDGRPGSWSDWIGGKLKADDAYAAFRTSGSARSMAASCSAGTIA